MSFEKSFLHKFMRNSPIGMIAFLVAFISFSALSPIETTDAAEILSALDNNGSAVSISTANNTIDLSLSADTAGAVRTASDVVTVTAGSSGYQLYISTIGANNALVRDGTTGTNANDIIPASTVTSISSPAVLTNNTWGFAVPARNATSGSGSEDVVANGFGEASTYPTGDNSVATSKFIAIPAKGDDLLVAKRSSATPSSGNPTNFYYGVRATTAKPSGLYKATVTYTAIGDSITNNLASVTPERTNKLTGGELITISTPSTTALSSLGTITALVGGEPCLNPTATKNDSYVNVTCSAPALATGWHEVSVNFATDPPRAPCRHWNTALCSLSTGSILTPFARARPMTSPPAMTSTSFVASATSMPFSMAASVGRSPETPTVATRHTSASFSSTARNAAPSPT